MVLHDQNSGLYDPGDNWLKKEIDRERNMTAWELDGREAARLAHEKQCEAEAVRSLHQQNCDVRQVAAEHARAHHSAAVPVAAPVRASANSSVKNKTKSASNLVVTFLIVFFVIVIINVFSMVSAFSDGPFFVILPFFFFIFTLIIMLSVIFNIIKRNKEK